MSSPAQILKQYLRNEDLVTADGTSGVNAWPCFINSMPDEPDQCVCINDTGSAKQGRIMKTGEVIEKPSVQVLLRAKTFVVGWNKAKAIEALLDATLRHVLDVNTVTYKIQSVRRPQTVLPLGAEPGTTKRREFFSLNVLLSINPQ